MTDDILPGLIEGIPDAVALRILAHVPFSDHHQLHLVCRSWHSFLRSRHLFKIRCEANSTEELLCVLSYDPDNIWQLYNPQTDHWLTLPPMPSPIRHLARFGTATVAGCLFVLGGGSDNDESTSATNDVWAYNPLRGEWVRRANMLAPRAMFACCAVDGRIVVAGGFTNLRKSIPKAEVYDPETDMWAPLPDLCPAREYSCTGAMIGGRMHVLHKGQSTVQILLEGRKGWIVEDYGWLQGPRAVVRGETYVLNAGFVVRQRKEGPGADKVVSSASEFKNRISFGMIGLGDEIYVVGGVMSAGTDRSMKQMRDVDVLAVRGGGKWRRAAQLTLCQGSILGCALLRI